MLFIQEQKSWKRQSIFSNAGTLMMMMMAIANAEPLLKTEQSKKTFPYNKLKGRHHTAPAPLPRTIHVTIHTIHVLHNFDKHSDQFNW